MSKVISIATVENQEQILNITKTLSSRALETLARDNRHEKYVHVNTYSQQLFADVNLEPKVDLKIETRAILAELVAKEMDRHKNQNSATFQSKSVEF